MAAPAGVACFGVAAAAVVSRSLGDDARGEFTCVDICEGDFDDTDVEVRGETCVEGDVGDTSCCVDMCDGDLRGVSGAALAAYVVMSSCTLFHSMSFPQTLPFCFSTETISSTLLPFLTITMPSATMDRRAALWSAMARTQMQPKLLQPNLLLYWNYVCTRV